MATSLRVQLAIFSTLLFAALMNVGLMRGKRFYDELSSNAEAATLDDPTAGPLPTSSSISSRPLSSTTEDLPVKREELISTPNLQSTISPGANNSTYAQSPPMPDWDCSLGVCQGDSFSSTDAITMLIQKTHSTYDSSHPVDIIDPLTRLHKAYPFAAQADILLLHEGDFSLADVQGIKRNFADLNIRLCNVQCAPGVWGPPKDKETGETIPVADMMWSVGYRNMIRLYAVTIWDLLSDLGYTYTMRLDDDSLFLSNMSYNLFDALRAVNASYGFRQFAWECDHAGVFSDFVDGYVEKNNIVPAYGTLDTHDGYCWSLGAYGFYNNFFITKIDFWKQPKVKQYINFFDESRLIYDHRVGDLNFQTSAVKLFAKYSEVLQYVDWTYAHVTVRKGGKWLYGGLSIGTEDDVYSTTKLFQKWMMERWNVDAKDSSYRDDRCRVFNRLCGIVGNMTNCDPHKASTEYRQYKGGKTKRVEAPACGW
jgi:hypothetical protein